MIPIKVPPLGESITEATVSRWMKKEGDAVAIGDTLVELETDKITVEVPALNAGVLSKRLKQEGDVVQLAEMLAELDETATGGARSAVPAAAAPATPPRPMAPPTPATAPAPATATATASSAGDPPRAAPSAAKLADEKGVSLSGVTGSGRGGVISKPDVIAAMERPAPTAATSAPFAPPVGSGPAVPASPGTRETREKLSTRRKRIAENLLQAQHSTAHLTTFNEIDMTAVSTFRERMKEKVEKEHGVKLSFMPFFAKAACLALKAFPVVNSQLDGDSVIYKHYVNLGIAVASEAGLVVPNIKDADRMGMIGFSRAIGAVAKRARESKLTMDDLTGGTFTITNGGVFGSLVSTPIINYPQVAILGLHKVQDRPVAVNGQVVIRPMMYVALSYDHRIIDGQQAVLFLVRIKELMEDPAAMLIDD
jgi:2-oxoglutarate dehydrogenase E2 component (dihydrolipoamide succinyltransferase)